MGTAIFGRHGLQRIATCFFVIAFVLFAKSSFARAQILPFQETLEYKSNSDAPPIIVVKSNNGTPAYELTFRPERDINGNAVAVDLFLQRPDFKADARNLLEPRGRWHGLQRHMFVAKDLKDGPDKSVYGSVRKIHISNPKLDVTITTKVADVKRSTNDYLLSRLILKVELANAD